MICSFNFYKEQYIVSQLNWIKNNKNKKTKSGGVSLALAFFMYILIYKLFVQICF